MNVIGIALGVFFGIIIARGAMYETPPSLEIDSGKWYRSDFDVTDDVERKQRSGLTVYIDYSTGIQYVGTSFGGLTPRLDADGNVLTRRVER